MWNTQLLVSKQPPEDNFATSGIVSGIVVLSSLTASCSRLLPSEHPVGSRHRALHGISLITLAGDSSEALVLSVDCIIVCMDASCVAELAE